MTTERANGACGKFIDCAASPSTPLTEEIAPFPAGKTLPNIAQNEKRLTAMRSSSNTIRSGLAEVDRPSSSVGFAVAKTPVMTKGKVANYSAPSLHIDYASPGSPMLLPNLTSSQLVSKSAGPLNSNHNGVSPELIKRALLDGSNTQEILNQDLIDSLRVSLPQRAVTDFNGFVDGKNFRELHSQIQF